MRSPRFTITRCPSGKVVHHTYKRAVKQADRCDMCSGWHTGRRWMIHTTADLAKGITP